MQTYTISAYGIMFTLLFLVLSNMFQIVFWLSAYTKKLEINKQRLKTITNQSQQLSRRRSKSKEELSATVFLPVLEKIRVTDIYSSVAPTTGMFFTLTSFILAAQEFAAKNNAQNMFKAVAVGMGTTAIAAFILVLTKLFLSKLEQKTNHTLDNTVKLTEILYEKDLPQKKAQNPQL